jgi:hypothetical protein
MFYFNAVSLKKTLVWFPKNPISIYIVFFANYVNLFDCKITVWFLILVIVCLTIPIVLHKILCWVVIFFFHISIGLLNVILFRPIFHFDFNFNYKHLKVFYLFHPLIIVFVCNLSCWSRIIVYFLYLLIIIIINRFCSSEQSLLEQLNNSTQINK